MRLPLLIAGNVQKITNCATVRLPAGKWKIVVENQNDSILQFLRDGRAGTDWEYGTRINGSDDPFSHHKNDEGSVVGPASYTLHFQKKGTETDLNVYFEKVA
jgi:hypothetical protein